MRRVIYHSVLLLVALSASCSYTDGASLHTKKDYNHPRSLANELLSKCESDQDCVSAQVALRQANDTLTNQYCAQGVCLEFGTCMADLDCENPANDFFSTDCVGYLECQDGQCAKICGNATCPDGSDFVDCKVEPCQVNPCSDAVSCINDYCQGCSAIHFDAAGNQACLEEISATDTCQSDADCNATFYCSQGECLEQGACHTYVDCMNPSNQFPVATCVGHLECQDGGCTQVCGEVCPNGQEFAECFVNPCDVDTCDAGVSCVSSYCGSCDAIHFDAAGNRACTQSCETNDDCDADSYCSAGECLAMGGCHDVIDCVNPYNSYILIQCIGSRTCENGKCGIVCGGEPHCCFSRCSNETVADCEEAASCVVDNCNNCGSILFDLAGNRVCDELGTFSVGADESGGTVVVDPDDDSSGAMTANRVWSLIFIAVLLRF